MYPFCLLIVDDDPLLQAVARAHYAALGIKTCDTASSAEDALAKFNGAKQPYDLVVCDISMPGMDGVQLIGKFAAAGFRGWLAIVSSMPQTVCNTVQEIARSYGMQFAGSARKPISASQLEGFVRTMHVAHTRKVAGQQAVADRMAEQQLQSAIDEGRVIPFYQPIVDMKTGAVVSAEALARIVDRDGSILSPAAFIPVAISCGLLDQLTHSMFNTMLTDFNSLSRHARGINLAINWDPKLLECSSLPEDLQATCRDKHVSPNQITLEITEATAFEASSTILEVLVRLRLKGFGIAVDDYGIGYSNLERLRQMPFSKLKIDQSFVRNAMLDRFSKVSVETTVRLARELDIPTIAEGLEDEALWALMQQLGVDQGQGYLVSRPLPIDRFINWGNSCGWAFHVHDDCAADVRQSRQPA